MRSVKKFYHMEVSEEDLPYARLVKKVAVC